MANLSSTLHFGERVLVTRMGCRGSIAEANSLYCTEDLEGEGLGWQPSQPDVGRDSFHRLKFGKPQTYKHTHITYYTLITVAFTNLRTFSCRYIYICIHLHLHIFTFNHMHLHLHLHLYICIYICICICVSMYLHLHLYTFAFAFVSI